LLVSVKYEVEVLWARPKKALISSEELPPRPLGDCF